MMEITAKENATIQIIDGSFPLGQRNTIKINVEDNLLKEYINIIGTKMCLEPYNLYSYGDFNSITGITLNLNEESSVEAIPYYLNNYSNCLYCKTTNEIDGLGLCEFKPDKGNLIVGKEYILSLFVNTTSNNISFDLYEGDSVTDTLNVPNTEGKWKQISTTFIASNENFYLKLIMPAPELVNNECYIDTLQLFEFTNEIDSNEYSNIGIEIAILNPIQELKSIDEVISYNLNLPSDEDLSEDNNITQSADNNENTDNTENNIDIITQTPYIMMFVPPITTVDFQDNLLCSLNIYIYNRPKDNYFNNYKYNEIKELVYQSDPFILNGFILPPESENN